MVQAMTESKFYSELLGLEKPWEVESVHLDKQAMEVLVKVRCKQTVWVCPDTRQRVHIHQGNTRRRPHLDPFPLRTATEATAAARGRKNHVARAVEKPISNGLEKVMRAMQ